MRNQHLEKHLSKQDDATLVARIHSRRYGWQQAFTTLVHRHRDGLLRLCQARLANSHDAEDAVQETILRAYRAIGGFKGEAGFSTWLHTIAENQCKTLAVRRNRHLMSEHLRELVLLQDAMRQDRRLPSASAKWEVHKTLAGMSQSSRDVLMLRFFGDLSIEQIAHTLGIGLSATKMRLYRAQEQFADRYVQAEAA